MPALQAASFDIRRVLHEDGRGLSSSRRQRRLRAGLVVAEIALALVLLISAGHALRSFSALTRVAPGFDPSNLLVVSLPLSPVSYDDPVRRARFAARIVGRVAALPGVQHSALTTTLPMAAPTGIINFNRTAQPPRGPADDVAAGFRAVTPDYLATLRVPLLSGRPLEPSDAGGIPEVVVINQSMANRFFAGRDPVGQRIQLGTIPSNEAPVMRIVGIVGDVRKSLCILRRRSSPAPAATRRRPWPPCVPPSTRSTRRSRW